LHIHALFLAGDGSLFNSASENWIVLSAHQQPWLELQGDTFPQ
jgi:hypothetical protein